MQLPLRMHIWVPRGYDNWLSYVRVPGPLASLGNQATAQTHGPPCSPGPLCGLGEGPPWRPESLKDADSVPLVWKLASKLAVGRLIDCCQASTRYRRYSWEEVGVVRVFPVRRAGAKRKIQLQASKES